jgi:hypothetical protein
MVQLNAKYRQYQKLRVLVEKHELFEYQLAEIKGSGLAIRTHFYTDSDSLRLTIQKDIEKIFEAGGLLGVGFNWILDAPGDIRKLRAQVSFDGAQEQMIKVLWGISHSEKIMRQISWRQQMKSFDVSELGTTKGSITLEFYAVKPDYFGLDASKIVPGSEIKNDNE